VHAAWGAATEQKGAIVRLSLSLTLARHQPHASRSSQWQRAMAAIGDWWRIESHLRCVLPFYLLVGHSLHTRRAQHACTHPSYGGSRAGKAPAGPASMSLAAWPPSSHLSPSLSLRVQTLVRLCQLWRGMHGQFSPSLLLFSSSHWSLDCAPAFRYG
jgi:hypothetical protein